jgi:hypothetical protein
MKDRIVALGFVLFAIVFLAGSLPLKVGTAARPGAGFMPAVVGVCLLVAAAYNLFRQFRAPALAATLGSFLFFGKLLSVVLPSGVLEDAILAF